MSRIRFNIWRYGLEKSFFRRIAKFVMKRAYPWFDFSYLFMMMQDWLDYASSQHKEQGNSVASGRIAKQMGIASQVCRRLSTGYIEDNAYKVVFDDKDFIPPQEFPWFPEVDDKRRYKRLFAFEKQSYLYHMGLLTRIISKYSHGWWD